MKLLAKLLLTLVLAGCAPIQPPNNLDTISFISKRYNVIVCGYTSGYLTEEMADVMEQDLSEQTKALGLSEHDLLACLMGTVVHVSPSTTWRCSTRANGISKDLTCVGQTDGRWQSTIGHIGRCAYSLGAKGPPYEHELTHIAMRCAGMSIDWDHINPIWSAINFERPCP